MRLHVILTAIVFGVYFLAAFFYSPHFFLSDVRAKIHVLADTVSVTATVLGAPAKPSVTIDSSCSDSDASVNLRWSHDENSYTYDIMRDNSLLVAGLTDVSYSDSNVSAGQSYIYAVIAHGPMGPGSAASSGASVTVPSGCGAVIQSTSVSPLPTSISVKKPAVRVTSVGELGRSTLRSGIAILGDSTPKLSGTTSMPFALIDIVIHSDIATVLHTQANENGYWEVYVPVALTPEKYTMYVTATDPDDSSRSVTQIILFQLLGERGRVDAGNGGQTASIAEELPLISKDAFPDAVKRAMLVPNDFTLRIYNSDRSVFSGDSLKTELIIISVSDTYASTRASIHYRVIDATGTVVAILDRRIESFEKNQSMRESLIIPESLKPGKYALQAALSVENEIDIVRSVDFSVGELPLLDLGAGSVVTYPQFVRNIGWFSFVSLFSLSSWSLLWIREYWLLLHAKRRIIGRNLANKGFMAKRKGVFR